MDWRHIGELLEAGGAVYGAMLNLVVWVKSNAGQGSFYRSQHELIGVFRVGEERISTTSSWGATAGRGRTSGITPGSTRFGLAGWTTSSPIRPSSRSRWSQMP